MSPRVPSFSARIEIIGVNPFVHVPDDVLAALFARAKRDRGPIPVCGTIDGHSYRQTLVKYAGHWRFYVNGPMLKATQKKLGEVVTLTVRVDRADRTVPLIPKFAAALRRHAAARRAFAELSPHRQKEIARYLAALKTEESVKRNIVRAIRFLAGKENFVGRKRR
ncbi:MAG TPA: DUF1905 domain-containing protein [Candidatus Didemnitutus sp.]|nr:DUF1905 domain-containing protein [Candidatus Didemnitutus sp.]